MKRLAFALLAAVTLASSGCATSKAPSGGVHPASGGGVGDVQVSLYRGVKVTALGGNTIDWGATSFGVSGLPPTLSLFDHMGNPLIPCWISFEVTYPGNGPPVPNGVATVTVPAPGVWNPGPWAVTFNNVPAGHWEILRAIIGGGSNNQSSAFAAAAFHAKMLAGEVQIHDGAAVGCH